MKVAWISDYPVEWMPDPPEALRGRPRGHPATWMPVLLEEFTRRPDISLHVLLLRKGIPADVTFERQGATFHVLRTPGRLRAPSLFWIDTHLIGRRLRALQPDLVHAWGTERGAALVASRLPYPSVVTMQGLLDWYRQVVPLNAYERFAALLERLSLRRSRVVTTESHFAVDFLRARHPRLRVFKAEHAPNRVFHQIQRRPVTRPLRLLTVGTFAYRKGSDVLLRALNQLVDQIPFTLRVVGHADPALLDRLRRELSPQLWEKVAFLPGLTPPEVAAELAEATLAVLPTRADTSPNAVKEAVVAGVPVVSTRVGGVVDYVFPGENGLLCAPGDVPGLVSALKQAAEHPLFGQGRVSPAALERVRADLSPEQMARNFFEAYQAALGQNPS
ncbi:MAG: hypothetical protein RJA22_802 [Verrucomicrobiota bacterium]|jgi:glycosyltransferase involved in cell wall biosynthesis